MAIIDKPSDYFNTKLFTGNGGTNAISGIGFQPDWIWFKNRTSAQSHAIVDSVRGRKGLQSNATDAEYTLASGKDFGTFDSDGFTVLTPQQLNSFNYNTGSIVSWNWKAGTSFSNSSGSNGANLDSTGSVSTTAGFSIVSFTGNRSTTRNIYHGLGAVPKMIIFKNRDTTNGWTIYNEAIGNANKLTLNGTNASGACTACFASTTPTSTLFTVGDDSDTNGTSNNMIAYCFADVQGYSKFGSYTGNGSTDGPFVYTGFKPAWVLQKNASATQGWQLQDNKRNGFNGANKLLQPNATAAESDVNRIDILSNGFKVITTDAGQNTSSNSYVYIAFAENPFTSSAGTPVTAR